MNDILIAAMPGESAPAERLAKAASAPWRKIEVHHFPDGESRVRVPAAAKTAIIYCSLDRPNAKLVELGLAASAFRDLDAERLVLAAPYLCYMRQDTAFAPGEAVSQKVVAAMLANWFNRVVTIEPHLHRTRSLSRIFPDTETTAISAAPLLARLIRDDGDASSLLIVGPDQEARQWAEAVATEVGAPYALLEKTRSSDRSVSVNIGNPSAVRGRRAVIVDDVVSTGETLAAAARLLKSYGADRVEAAVVHALFDDEALQRMCEAGIARIRSTDSVRHKTNAIEVAPLLAKTMSKEFLP